MSGAKRLTQQNVAGWLVKARLGLALNCVGLGGVVFCGGALLASHVAVAQDSAASKAAEGKALYKEKNFDAAAAAFERAIELDPSLTDAYMGLGRTQEKLKQFEIAAITYEKAVQKFPDQLDFLQRQGVVYRQLKQYPASAQAYRAYIAKKPEEPDAYFGLAQTLQGAGDIPGAITAAEQYIALEKRPEEQKYVERARDLLVELRAASPAAPSNPPTDTAAVTPTVTPPDATPPTTLPERAPLPPPDPSLTKPVAAASDANAALTAADQAFAAQDYTAAVNQYRAVIAARPGLVEAHYKLGVALACLQQFGLAIDAWEQALKLSPDLAIARENITRAQRRLAVDTTLDPDDLTNGTAEQRAALIDRYLSENRFSMALRAAEGLRALAPADPKTHRRLAQIYLGLIQPTQALEALNTELSLQPGDFEIYALMGEAHAQQRDPHRAAYFYTLFLDNVDPDRTSPAHTEPRARLEQLTRLAEQSPPESPISSIPTNTIPTIP